MTVVLKLQDKHKEYIRDIGAKAYWPNEKAKKAIINLVISESHQPFEPSWEYMRLPGWASDLEVEGKGLRQNIYYHYNMDSRASIGGSISFFQWPYEGRSTKRVKPYSYSFGCNMINIQTRGLIGYFYFA